MKFLLLLLGYLAVLSQIGADCVQEVQEAKPHDISNICTNQLNWALLPHPHNCHKFFVCANHVPEEFTCERHYYFDAQAKRCVRGSCNAVKECQSWVRAANDDCHAFEICENGKYERHQCTEHHYFNADLGMCKQIERTPEHMCSCLLPQYTTIENPHNCETYYVCKNGRAVEQKCARGSYFNSRLSACVIDLLGICVSAPTMSPEESEMLDTCERLVMHAAAVAAVNDDNDKNDIVVFVPDAKDCEKFYMCVNGRAVAKQCPIGFYYDREAEYCEFDTNGVCEAMREEAKKKQEQAEKEAAEENPVAEGAIDSEPPKPPLHLSLSYTHLKVEADKGGVAAAAEPRPAQEFQHSHMQADSSVEIMHTADLIMPPPLLPSPPVLLKHPAKLSQILEAAKPASTNESGPQENKIENENAEKTDNSNSKLPLTEKLHAELKVPGNSAYDKLASKFIAF